MCEKMRINFLVICYGLTWGCGNSGMTEFFRAFSPIQEDVSIALSLWHICGLNIGVNVYFANGMSEIPLLSINGSSWSIIVGF